MVGGSERVAIVTGGGRGIGRSYAVFLAAQGLRMVVNSATVEDEGSSAEQVVREIQSLGGTAVAHVGPIGTWDSADALVRHALDEFGRLDVLVNNAGLLRDRTIVNMSESEWDDVQGVHLKAQAATLHFAAAYWRDRRRHDEAAKAAVVNTTAGAGLYGNFGQANYAAAKAGVVGLTLVAARELGRYGVRVNAVAPVARTRQTESLNLPASPGPDGDTFDPYDADNIAPVVGYLVSLDCPLTGQVINVQGGEVDIYQGWSVKDSFRTAGRWSVDALSSLLNTYSAEPPEFAPPRLGS
jgi:NAD(P)-dependent dehydrogenase (short-subunit alcohol dehydrogenase family)